MDDKLKIYRENFEKAYIEATENFYKAKASEYKLACGIFNAYHVMSTFFDGDYLFVNVIFMTNNYLFI